MKTDSDVSFKLFLLKITKIKFQAFYVWKQFNYEEEIGIIITHDVKFCTISSNIYNYRVCQRNFFFFYELHTSVLSSAKGTEDLFFTILIFLVPNFSNMGYFWPCFCQVRSYMKDYFLVSKSKSKLNSKCIITIVVNLKSEVI